VGYQHYIGIIVKVKYYNKKLVSNSNYLFYS